MPKNRNALTAGIFMLAAAAAAIAIVLGIAGSGQFSLHFVPHQISFAVADNIGGLRKGDDVRLGGVKVGSVESIKVVRKDTMSAGKPVVDSIIIVISIPAEYVLANNANVSIETSLTGVTDVNISDLGSGAALADNEMLPGHPDALTAFKASLADLGPKLTADLDTVHDTLATFKTQGARVGDDVHGLSADLHTRLQQVTEATTRPLDDVHAWLGPSTGDFHLSMSNVRDITGHVKDKLPPLTAGAQQFIDHLNATITGLQSNLADIKTMVNNLAVSSATIRNVLERNHGRIDELISSLDSTILNLRTFSQEISGNPAALLLGPDDSQKTYNAARQFADGARALSDAASDLRAALAQPQPDTAKVQELYNNLNDQFTKFREVEDGLWKQLK